MLQTCYDRSERTAEDECSVNGCVLNNQAPSNAISPHSDMLGRLIASGVRLDCAGIDGRKRVLVLLDESI